MKRHPSGRPIRREEKRSYSMAGGFPREGFICPRLNEAVRPRHDTYAVGFMSGHEPRDDLYLYTEAKR
jgi:hypothetical protein